MELKKLFTTEERAVSPVIAVVLMIAVTVILAAVVAAFALGLGGSGQASPQASMDFDYTNSTGAPGDELVVTHDGGDSIGNAELNASVSNAYADDDATATDGGTAGYESARFTGDLYSSGSVSAGTSDTISGGDFQTAQGDDFDTTADHLDLSASTVRVVWTSESGDDSATIGRWSGPEA